MHKKLPLLLLMISTIYIHSQQITFQKNVNNRANVLLQNINKNRDSLLLESKHQEISQVVIFNDDFSENIDVSNNKTKIDLKALPLGNFIIQAKVDNKWIVMYLQKHEDVKIASSDQTGKVINTNNLASMRKANLIEKTENPLYYWVVSESNSNFGSNKSMKLEYKEDVAKLISKNKLELKSDIGKANKLLIYSVYNKSKFMNKQFRNPDYYKSAENSKFFNTEPFYTSDKKEADSNP